jgi:hypothetical protein
VEPIDVSSGCVRRRKATGGTVVHTNPCVVRETPKEHQRCRHAYLFTCQGTGYLHRLSMIPSSITSSSEHQLYKRTIVFVVDEKREMSRRTRQPAAVSRRTRRTEQQPQAVEFGFTETQRVVSNPIFYCGGNGDPSQLKLQCVYGPGAVRALVHDPAAAGSSGGIGTGKPLPLPPCRTHHRGARVGPAVVVRGRFLRRRVHHNQDPFLAAYVACTNGSGGDNVKRHREEKKTRKCDKGGVIRRGYGVWSGWAAGARYAGAAMSCKNGCAVLGVHSIDAPAAAAKKEQEAEAPERPMLDLSWAPVVASARALERRREQR